jgi:hypothetical protein
LLGLGAGLSDVMDSSKFEIIMVNVTATYNSEMAESFDVVYGSNAFFDKYVEMPLRSFTNSMGYFLFVFMKLGFYGWFPSFVYLVIFLPLVLTAYLLWVIRCTYTIFFLR